MLNKTEILVLEECKEKLKKKKKFMEIFHDKSEIKIWEELPNGCFIGTMGYSKENIMILKELLKSFEEQYGEVIDYQAAEDELKLYQEQGKLFIYFDENMKPVSMNGCVYNYDNETVDFASEQDDLNNFYIYGLSTLHEFRGRGACRALIDYSMDYAECLGFDYIYARTDLVDSNSEWIMAKAGMEVCKYDGKIIAEWVDVTEDTGDYRLHMWMPLKHGITVLPKGPAYYANDDEERAIIGKRKQKVYSKSA